MAELRLSERELSKRAGLSPQAVNKLLGDDAADLRTSTFLGICAALEIDPAVLLGGPARSPGEEGARDELQDRVAAIEARLNASREPEVSVSPDPGKARLRDLIENLEPGEVEAAQTLLIYLFDRLEARRRKKHA